MKALLATVSCGPVGSFVVPDAPDASTQRRGGICCVSIVEGCPPLTTF